MKLRPRKKSGTAEGERTGRKREDIPKRMFLFLIVFAAALILLKTAVVDPLISANGARLAAMDRSAAAENAGTDTFFDGGGRCGE